VILGLDKGDNCEKLNSTQRGSTGLNSTQLKPELRLKNGFSLVELSIVLVLVGLLVAAVTVGSNMIERATLNKVIKDIDKFKTASAMFKEKYFDLPGDLKDATMYWGTAADCAVAQADGTTLTCNGNGDGVVGYPHITLDPTSHQEPAHFMRQLGNTNSIK
jgi:prepilin-type N-terminal cleavage/methylation domain-containing protein